MTQNEWIREASQKLVPVSPQPRAWQMTLPFFFLACVLSGIGLFFSSLRADLSQSLSALLLPVMGSALFVSAFLICLGMILSAFPGRTDSRNYLKMGVSVLAAVGAALFFRWLKAPSVAPLEMESARQSAECTGSIFLFSLAPAALFFLVLRRFAPTSLRLTGLCVGLATTVLAAVAVQFCCPNNESFHLLSAHLLVPLMLGGGLGAWLGPFFLRW